MREGARAQQPAWFRRLTRREWAWLGASLLVALAIVATLIAFGSYGNSRGEAASHAVSAELAASQVNALEWRSIGDGRVPPARAARIRQLLGAIAGDPQQIEPAGGLAHRVLAVYAAAVGEELRLIGAGQIGAARRVDEERVDPAFRVLGAALQRTADENTRAASRATTLKAAGDLVAVGLGFVIVVVLLLRSGAVERRLAAAAVQEQLLRKMDKAKNDLISVVSHDLRTPLTSIIGYLELLQDSAAGPLRAGQRQLLDVVVRNADRLLIIANDLLFVSRAEAGMIALTLTEVSLQETAADTVEALRPAAVAQGIHLRFVGMPSAPIMADRNRIDVLIENLLSNALKFTPAGGSVEVAVRPAGHRVRLEVSDTGIGISPEDQEHLFEKFFRSLDRVDTPGAGLGLAIAKAIIDAHHASVTVRSTPGKGTTFCVEFPLSGGPVVAGNWGGGAGPGR
ncbi:MAG TPA: hypothetical protein DHU96_14545 [Actinobacteria bacterium]|nr:hypothetical protein [Actinomycetota bacterium]